MSRRTAIPYAEAIRWIIENDDVQWLDDENGIISVTASFAADVYSRTDQEIIADLRKAAGKRER